MLPLAVPSANASAPAARGELSTMIASWWARSPASMRGNAAELTSAGPPWVRVPLAMNVSVR